MSTPRPMRPISESGASQSAIAAASSPSPSSSSPTVSTDANSKKMNRAERRKAKFSVADPEPAVAASQTVPVQVAALPAAPRPPVVFSPGWKRSPDSPASTPPASISTAPKPRPVAPPTLPYPRPPVPVAGLNPPVYPSSYGYIPPPFMMDHFYNGYYRDYPFPPNVFYPGNFQRPVRFITPPGGPRRGAPPPLSEENFPPLGTTPRPKADQATAAAPKSPAKVLPLPRRLPPWEPSPREMCTAATDVKIVVPLGENAASGTATVYNMRMTPVVVKAISIDMNDDDAFEVGDVRGGADIPAEMTAGDQPAPVALIPALQELEIDITCTLREGVYPIQESVLVIRINSAQSADDDTEIRVRLSGKSAGQNVAELNVAAVPYTPYDLDAYRRRYEAKMTLPMPEFAKNVANPYAERLMHLVSDEASARGELAHQSLQVESMEELPSEEERDDECILVNIKLAMMKRNVAVRYGDLVEIIAWPQPGQHYMTEWPNSCEAQVHHVDYKATTVCVLISHEYHKALSYNHINRNMPLSLHVNTNLRPYNEMRRTLEQYIDRDAALWFMRDDPIQSNYPQLTGVDIVQLAAVKAATDPDNGCADPSELSLMTQNQSVAVRLALADIKRRNPTCPWMQCIMGAAGTGKTSTLIDMVRIGVQRKEMKVLLAAPSDTMADALCQKLSRYFNNTQMLRVNDFSRPVNEVADSIHGYCYRPGDYYDLPPPTQLASYSIIIVHSAWSWWLRDGGLGRSHFDLVVLDEACQATEPETLMLMRFASPSARFVMAGDVLQMKPAVIGKAALKGGLDVSLQTRLWRALKEAGKTDTTYITAEFAYVPLTSNFRMSTEIHSLLRDNGGQQLSYAFGTPGLNVADGWPMLPNPSMPAMFVNLESEQVFNGWNPRETLAVAGLVRNFLQWNYEASSVGSVTRVLAPQVAVIVGSLFQEHVAKMRVVLRGMGLDAVKVLRVSEVQGQEYRAVFLSTVHSSIEKAKGEKAQQMGVLHEDSDLHVAMTRGRGLVVVVGNEDVLLGVGGEYWNRTIPKMEKIEWREVQERMGEA